MGKSILWMCVLCVCVRAHTSVYDLFAGRLCYRIQPGFELITLLTFSNVLYIISTQFPLGEGLLSHLLLWVCALYNFHSSNSGLGQMSPRVTLAIKSLLSIQMLIGYQNRTNVSLNFFFFLEDCHCVALANLELTM